MGQQLSAEVTCDPALVNSAAYASSSNLYSVNGRNFAPLCGSDTTGPTLRVTGADFYDCIEGCAADPSCQAISWIDDQCYQKSQIGDIVDSPHGVSSFVDFFAEDVSCPNDAGTQYDGFTIQCGVDYPGVGDMGNSQEPALTDCVDSCANTIGCVAVVYSGSTCYRKNEIGPAVNNAGVSGAVLAYLPPYVAPTTPPVQSNGPSCPTADSTTVNGFLIACATDYYGGDLTSMNTETFGDCISACETNSACVDVSFVPPNSCYLKQQLTTPSTNDGVWNARRLNIAAPPVDPADNPNCPGDDNTSYTVNDISFTIHCYNDYRGGDYGSLPAAHFSDCLAACAGDAQCVDVAWNAGMCYLKSTVMPAVSDQNVWGALKSVALPVLDTTALTDNSTSITNTTISADRRARRRVKKL